MPENYRPISLTSILSKTLEHIICSSMWKHIDTYDLLTNCQHGFRKKFNTTTQLLHVTYKAAQALDNRSNYHIVSLDFRKAFDKVPHNLLILKLTRYKFDSRVIVWIKEWLRSRSSVVKVNGQTSKEFEVLSGVPQGSVLGPLLFLIYINDMPLTIKNSECRLYADDTLLCYDWSTGGIIGLQNDIDSLYEWSVMWHMPFNINKCVHMQIGRDSPECRLKLNDQAIPTASEIKYLGLTLSNDMKWRTHILNTGKKANKTLGIVRRCLDGADSKTKLLAFNSVVRPILEYATQVWSPHVDKLSMVIDTVHRRALRWIFKLKKRESLQEIMEENGIVSLANRRKEQDILFLRRIEFGDYGIHLEKYVKLNTAHNTRHGVINNAQRINAFKYHFFNRVAADVKVLIPGRYS